MPPKRESAINKGTAGEPPTKKDNSGQAVHAQSGISCEAICQGYNATHTFTLACSFDSLKDKQFTKKIVIGNHLKWRLSARLELDHDDDSEDDEVEEEDEEEFEDEDEEEFEDEDEEEFEEEDEEEFEEEDEEEVEEEDDEEVEEKDGDVVEKEWLKVFVWSKDAVKYPMEYEIEYKLNAKHAKDRIVKITKNTYDDPLFTYCGISMITHEKFMDERDKFEVDGKITLTAKINVRMPMCYNFGCEHAFSDVKVHVGDVSLPLIKTNLAIHSCFFNTMFFGSFKEANQEEVILKDVDIISFVTLINVLFVRTFKLKLTSISSVLKLADQFGMLTLVEYCKKKLLKCDRCSEISLTERLVIAAKYSFQDLKKRCLKLCDSPKTIKKVMESHHYKHLPAEVKAQLLKRMVEVMPKNVLK